ncbi:hypothetical protein DM860_013417 [Cuscuta australis]|uniref:Wall-associated receptor kinase C-terminal domain-containing protein n=1 Tax=Cuscuta australis TaxID=267555 RepID=A0A328DP49_9ASTE|nr:hypothetical protein DM860_013417 [Cuscuta australis]
MQMDMLDCTHYTSFYATDDMLRNGGGSPTGRTPPMLWAYGIKLSFALPPDGVGCDCCIRTGGTCGFDVVTRAPSCITSSSSLTTTNYTTVSRLVCDLYNRRSSIVSNNRPHETCGQCVS